LQIARYVPDAATESDITASMLSIDQLILKLADDAGFLLLEKLLADSKMPPEEFVDALIALEREGKLEIRRKE
jgi:hypothetical protein